MKVENVVIYGLGAVSSMGSVTGKPELLSTPESAPFYREDFAGREICVARVSADIESEIERLATEHEYLRGVDRCVELAVVASRLARNGIEPEAFKMQRIGINIGSSRGATAIWEREHRALVEGRALAVATSPLSTLGNISSWVAQECGASSLVLSHSVTCATALHALANAVAWIGAGMSDIFIAGGSEAALTPFTIAQMGVLRLLSPLVDEPFPCQPFGVSGRNTLVLGEGAGVLLIGREGALDVPPLARILGLGVAQDMLKSPTSISENGESFTRAMLEACSGDVSGVDAVVAHAPGTLRGDSAELVAIRNLFGADSLPLVASNKHLIGHTFGAAGALSIAESIAMLGKTVSFAFPYSAHLEAVQRTVKKVLVNGAGFGGNHVSVLLGVSGR